MEPSRMYDYLCLSREHLFGWIRPLDDARYREEHPIGLGSMARTLHHMRAAERSYMWRAAGNTSPLANVRPEDDPEVSTETAMGFGELVESWTALSEDTQAIIAGVTDWTTPRVCETTWEGKPFRYEASSADFFSQLVVHEAHHRAQVMHMLHRIGVELEDIDFNALMWRPVGG